MTGIKGYALVLVGILVFSGTCIYASEMYDDPAAQGTTDLEARATELMQDLREDPHLVVPDGGSGNFDPDDVMNVQGTALEQDDVHFQLEIIDISDHGSGFSRSVANGNPVQTAVPPSTFEEGEMVIVHSAASIHVGPDEVHGARLVLKVWEK